MERTEFLKIAATVPNPLGPTLSDYAATKSYSAEYTIKDLSSSFNSDIMSVRVRPTLHLEYTPLASCQLPCSGVKVDYSQPITRMSADSKYYVVGNPGGTATFEYLIYPVGLLYAQMSGALIGVDLEVSCDNKEALIGNCQISNATLTSVQEMVLNNKLPYSMCLTNAKFTFTKIEFICKLRQYYT